MVGRSRARTEERVFVIDGPRLVAEAIEAGIDVSEVYAGPDGWSELDGIVGLDPDVERFEVDPSVLASVLDPVAPRPMAAVAAMPDWSLEPLLAADGPLLVAVELRDPGNLGTVIRTAEAAGLDGVVVAGESVDRFNPKVVRASAGSLFRLPVVDGPDPVAIVERLRRSGRPVVATVVDAGARPYDEVDLSRAAILIGNEPNGLASAVTEEATTAVTIPMKPMVESLNVGAAASVLCFEAARQRRGRSAGPDGRNRLDSHPEWGDGDHNDDRNDTTRNEMTPQRSEQP